MIDSSDEGTQKPKELPEGFQLDELEVLRLTSVQAMSDKVILELELGRIKVQEIQRFLKERETAIRDLSMKARELIMAIGDKHGVGGDVLRYHLNLETGEAVLKVPVKAPVPPEPPKEE